MKQITTHLWFDTQAKEAATFYTGVFPNSRIESIVTLPGTPSGDTDIVTLNLAGLPFQFISAGPMFKINPSVSFQVACASKAEVDTLWQALAEAGTPLMELGAYPFSEWFGWIQDRYGVSWQIMHTAAPIQQKITPMLMFVGAQAGKAEEAIRFYASLFPNAAVGSITHYGPSEAPDAEGTVKQAAFMLAGQHFTAMDSAHAHDFQFNEAISLMVYCDTQAEIDHYWDSLTADPTAEQCGWLKDRFGLSWQIVPTAMDAMMADPDPAKIARVTEAFLQMKKFDLAALQRAYAG